MHHIDHIMKLSKPQLLILPYRDEHNRIYDPKHAVGSDIQKLAYLVSDIRFDPTSVSEISDTYEHKLKIFNRVYDIKHLN